MGNGRHNPNNDPNKPKLTTPSTSTNTNSGGSGTTTGTNSDETTPVTPPAPAAAGQTIPFSAVVGASTFVGFEVNNSNFSKYTWSVNGGVQHEMTDVTTVDSDIQLSSYETPINDAGGLYGVMNFTNAGAADASIVITVWSV